MVHPAVELKARTKDFALRVIRLIRALPAGIEGRVIGGQLLRSATSVAAITELCAEPVREPTLFQS